MFKKHVLQHIFYIADYSSVPQVYSYNLSNNKTYRHTLSKYGVGRFLVSADKIVYSDYTAKGYTIVIDTLKYKYYSISLLLYYELNCVFLYVKLKS